MSAPRSWAELQARLGNLVDGEWLRQGLEAGFGVSDPADLDRRRRSLALQKLSGVLLELEDFDGDLAFALDPRREVRQAFARYLGGVVVEGPPWRIGPTEMDRPTRSEWEKAVPF